MKNTTNIDFNAGERAMIGHCLAALSLVESGRWTVSRMKQWLNACLDNDAKFLEAIKPELERK